MKKFDTYCLVLVAALMAGPVGADVPCASGGDKVGSLGIRGLSSQEMTMNLGSDPAETRVWFGQEPEITDVDPDSSLRRGDVIVAIDGTLITTRSGGSRLLHPEPEKPLTLTVRRRGREISLEATPSAVCPEDAFLLAPPPVPPRPPAVPRAPRAPAAPRAPLAPAAPAALSAPAAPAAPTAPATPRAPLPPRPPLPASDGWFGLGFECSDCRVDIESGEPRLLFKSPPVIYSVDAESPGGRAGLRRGDLLTQVDGLAITTRGGSEGLFDTAPGSRVRLTFERNGDSREVEVRAEQHPSLLGGEHLRYAGSLGDVDLEVRGRASVDVTVDEARGTILIRTLDAVVRLRKTAGETGD